MRLILKKKKALPKAPKTETMRSIDNYNKRLDAVRKFNAEVESYNKALIRKAEVMQQRVAGVSGTGSRRSKKW